MDRLIYAGIGARATPADVLHQMTALARTLADTGWHLHSGGAAGADSAFAAGAPLEQRTIFLPWTGFRELSGPDCRIASVAEMESLRAEAQRSASHWRQMSRGVQALTLRNVAIVHGLPMGSARAHAVVCYRPDARRSSGTARTMAIAARAGIPVLNLAHVRPDQVLERLNTLAARNRR